ncbi:uncharacterized protein B0I36DRAFT_361086 [Microdochium trichocladiopsis]|uniref:Transmembrane protein n=1 Tax=Microdochium trichocladiopsis TaxID=1682393 RepID=A0A9P8YF10_9PEZI|nr:uncharacterized protein B0I36DRAFT_361086 [Microdochium trichocladiopsis]KAH7035756.1 hypothetical protein B0I36DRAFT_361086 [Microdochium trichocladiopsis]
MIWTHLVLNTVDGCIAWFYLFRKIKPGFWIFLWFCIVWAIQIQLVMQIIINRIALLMSDQHRARQLKWITFVIVGIIGVVVTVVWMPASLQISPMWIEVNKVWDRLKQCILTVMDVCLNFYFLHMVRKHLIANGLQKYKYLYNYNAAMVGLVVLLDATLIGLMSLQVKYAYLQFQIIVYLTRFYIEMANADLIRKIISRANFDNDNSSVLVRTSSFVDGEHPLHTASPLSQGRHQQATPSAEAFALPRFSN